MPSPPHQDPHLNPLASPSLGAGLVGTHPLLDETPVRSTKRSISGKAIKRQTNTSCPKFGSNMRPNGPDMLLILIPAPRCPTGQPSEPRRSVGPVVSANLSRALISHQTPLLVSSLGHCPKKSRDRCRLSRAAAGALRLASHAGPASSRFQNSQTTLPPLRHSHDITMDMPVTSRRSHVGFPFPLAPHPLLTHAPSSWSLCSAAAAFADLQAALTQAGTTPAPPPTPELELGREVYAAASTGARARLATIRTPHCSTSTPCTAGRGKRWRGGGDGWRLAAQPTTPAAPPAPAPQTRLPPQITDHQGGKEQAQPPLKPDHHHHRHRYSLCPLLPAFRNPPKP